MRHAEFEECMAHEAFVKEMQKAYAEVHAKTFEFQDFRERTPRPTAEEVIDQAVSNKGKTSKDAVSNHRPHGLLSRIAAHTPAAGVIYPRSNHAPSSSSTPIPFDDNTSTHVPTAPPTPTVPLTPTAPPTTYGSNSPDTGSKAERESVDETPRHPALITRL